MSDELDVLKLVAQRLDAAGIRYMVSGSMAMNYYAQPRMTRDIDIVVELNTADAPRVASVFAADFYCDSDAIADAIIHQGMFNLIHSESVVKVDFIVRKHSRFRHAEFARRRCVDIQGAQIVVVTPEDLLLSKLHWAKDSRSELQLRDARTLIVSVPDLDWSYIDTWAAEPLGVRPAVGGAIVTDTPAHVENLCRDMLMRRSGSERLRMGCAMFETAKTLVRASLGDPTGSDNSADMRVRVFLRIYGQDFDARTAARILAHLRRDTGPERSIEGRTDR